MKQNIFSKKNQLDEMQEQTLRKIESRGFWLMWWGLFAVMIFQLMMQADISQVAGEWIVFMAACLYTLGRMPAQWHLGPPHQGQP